MRKTCAKQPEVKEDSILATWTLITTDRSQRTVNKPQQQQQQQRM